jgi:hypothetical protein
MGQRPSDHRDARCQALRDRIPSAMREEPAGARMVENTDLIKLPGLEHADVGGVDSVYDLLAGGGGRRQRYCPRQGGMAGRWLGGPLADISTRRSQALPRSVSTCAVCRNWDQWGRRCESMSPYLSPHRPKGDEQHALCGFRIQARLDLASLKLAPMPRSWTYRQAEREDLHVLRRTLDRRSL